MAALRGPAEADQQGLIEAAQEVAQPDRRLRRQATLTRQGRRKALADRIIGMGRT